MPHRSVPRATAPVRRSFTSLRLGAGLVLSLVSAGALSAAPTRVVSSPVPTAATWIASAPGAVFQHTTTPFDVGLLAALEAHGAIAGAAEQDSPPIDWRVLAGLDYLAGKATDTLKKLEGKQVRIPGFVVPLDDFQEDGAEFLLVPYYGACVHTPPPPPNQIVFVQMSNKKAVKLALFDAVWMHGKLKIATVESPYGTVGFTLDGMKMEPYSSR